MKKEILSRIGLLILAGGQSLRMGQDKANLPWGNATLLESLVKRGQDLGFGDILVSLKGDDRREALEHVTFVYDTDLGEGPLSGIKAGLRIGRQRGLVSHYWVVSVDMPFFAASLGQVWEAYLYNLDFMVLMPRVCGQLEPLAAVYHVACLEAVEKLWQAGERRVRSLAALDGAKIIDIEANSQAVTQLINVNTPLAYKLARAVAANQKRRVPVLSVVAAASKMGKTRLVEGLLQAWQTKNLAVGVAKSDGHGFSLDYEGTDTHKAGQAGAAAVGITGPEGYAIMVKSEGKPRLPVYELAQQLPVDLALLETRSQGCLPVIEVCDTRQGLPLISKAEDLIAIVTETKSENLVYFTAEGYPIDKREIAVFTWQEISCLAEWLYNGLQLYGR